MLPDESRPALRAVPADLRRRLEGRVETMAIAITRLELATEALVLDRLGPAQLTRLEELRGQLPAIEEALVTAQSHGALTELADQVRARMMQLTDALSHRLRRRHGSLADGLAALLASEPALESQPLLSAQSQRSAMLVPLLAIGLFATLAVANQSGFFFLLAIVATSASWLRSRGSGWTLTSRHLLLETDRVIPLSEIHSVAPLEGGLVMKLKSGEDLMFARDSEALGAALSLLLTPHFRELEPVARGGAWLDATDELAGLDACLLPFETGVLLVPTPQREKLAAAVDVSAALAPDSFVHAALIHLPQAQLEALAQTLAPLGVRWIPTAELTVTGTTLHTGNLNLRLPEGSPLGPTGPAAVRIP